MSLCLLVTKGFGSLEARQSILIWSFTAGCVVSFDDGVILMLFGRNQSRENDMLSE